MHIKFEVNRGRCASLMLGIVILILCIALVICINVPGTEIPSTSIPLTPTPDLGQKFLSKAGELCQNSYNLPMTSTSSTIPSQIVFLSFRDYERDYPGSDDYTVWHTVWGFVPPVEAQQMSDVEAIVCYKVQREWIGAYFEVSSTPSIVNPPGLVPGLPPIGGKQTGVGYKYIWDVRALAWPSGELLAAVTLSGSDPPNRSQGTGDRYGEPPSEEFDAWLRTLLPVK